MLQKKKGPQNKISLTKTDQLEKNKIVCVASLRLLAGLCRITGRVEIRMPTALPAEQLAALSRIRMLPLPLAPVFSGLLFLRSRQPFDLFCDPKAPPLLQSDYIYDEQAPPLRASSFAYPQEAIQ